jgi:hypothetical protein
MGRTFGVLVCAFLALPSLAFAQRFDDVGIRAQGMAGAFVAVADDATASWWNPAGLVNGLSLAELAAEGSEGGQWGVAFGFPSLGLSYYHLNISQIQPSGSTASTGSGRQDNGAAGSGLPSAEVGLNQFGATFGQSITGHLVVATTVKLVNAQDDTQADLDIGVMAAFGVVRLGATLRDAFNPTFGSGREAYEMGRRARAGAAVITPGFGPFDRLVFDIDADLNSAIEGGREEQDVAGGVEAWWLGRRVGVRGGGGTNTAAGGVSFGALGLTVVPIPHLNIDAALTRSADAVRDRWSVGLRVNF